MKLVSVIIPYYKKKNYLEKAINSALKQSYKKTEILIVYDDPDIEYLEILKKKFKRNNKIKFIINKKNLGAGISRNVGIKNASGQYIAFLDSDDTWNKDKLKIQLNFMENKRINITHTSYKIINEKNEIIGRRKAKANLNYQDLIKSCDIGLSTVVLKKKIIPKKNIFPILKTKEDYVLWLKLSKKKINIHGIDKDLVNWRKVRNSLSSSFMQKMKDGFMVYNKYMGYNLIISFFYLIRLSLNYVIKNNS